jgi:hypothetical protein
MDKDHFWRLIEESRSGCINPNSPNEHGKKLQEMLTLLEPAAILDFFVMFQDCLLRAYKWNLWAIPFIAYEGCSDDSFEEFRAWLISRGENFFEDALTEQMPALRPKVVSAPSDLIAYRPPPRQNPAHLPSNQAAPLERTP